MITSTRPLQIRRQLRKLRRQDPSLSYAKIPGQLAWFILTEEPETKDAIEAAIPAVVQETSSSVDVGLMVVGPQEGPRILDLAPAVHVG